LPILAIRRGADRFEFVLLVEHSLQTRVELRSSEGLEKVVVRGTLRYLNDSLIALLRGDHDEQGVATDQIIGPQVFEKLLAVGVLAQIVVTQDDVKGFRLQRLKCLTDIRHRQQAGATRAREGLLHLRAHGIRVINDQHALALKVRQTHAYRLT